MDSPVSKKQNPAFRTLSYILPYWYLILAATIGGVLKLTLPLVVPQMLRYFTDNLLPPENPMPVSQKMRIVFWSMILILAIYLFVYIPATYIREVGSLRVSNHIIHKMRCQLYDRLIRMSAGFHNENASGQLVSRINSDVEKVHDFIWSVATNVWIDSIIFAIYMALMIPINPGLTLLVCAVTLSSILITRKIREQIRKSGRKRQEELSFLSGYFQERMAGFGAIRLFHMEDWENNRFRQLSQKVFRQTKRQDTFSSLGTAVNATFYLFNEALVVGLCLLSVLRGNMTLGEVLVFYSYMGYLRTPLNRFIELNVTYAKSMAGIERVYEILDMPPDIEEKENALTLSDDAPLNLTFQHVSFRYRRESDEKALNDVTFTIEDGQKVALVGSSGCGKTTAVNLITRFYDPDEGCILLSGHDLRDYSLASLYRQMGMVFQDTVLFSETIGDNLKYGKPDATLQEMEQAAKAANAYEFIMKTPKQWDTLLGERGIGLSGGQRQRLAIARVFLCNPRFLILDEATSALDSESEEQVQAALDNLMEGRTSVVIAHRLSTIVNADKIIVMDQGRVVETGTHHELLERNGRYAELYQKQFKDVLGDAHEF